MSDVPDPLDDQDSLDHLAHRPIRRRVAASSLQPPLFTCPKCHKGSWNRNDAAYGYCGACHEFTGKPTPEEAFEMGRDYMAKYQAAKQAEPGEQDGPSNAP